MSDGMQLWRWCSLEIITQFQRISSGYKHSHKKSYVSDQANFDPQPYWIMMKCSESFTPIPIPLHRLHTLPFAHASSELHFSAMAWSTRSDEQTAPENTRCGRHTRACWVQATMQQAGKYLDLLTFKRGDTFWCDLHIVSMCASVCCVHIVYALQKWRDCGVCLPATCTGSKPSAMGLGHPRLGLNNGPQRQTSQTQTAQPTKGRFYFYVTSDYELSWA